MKTYGDVLKSDERRLLLLLFLTPLEPIGLIIFACINFGPDYGIP